jgi:maleylacetate reductase
VSSFRYESLPGRVVFGSGTLSQLPEEATRLHLRRVLIVCTPGQTALAERVATHLGDAAAGIFSRAAMHTPEEVTRSALDAARTLNTDGIVAIGGGSAIGLSKALALRTNRPQIVVPTTYAGSEATPILGETVDNIKRTYRSLCVLPETILYDVELTLQLPVGISMASGLNAMAHAAEALYAVDGNPLTRLMAQQALDAFVLALPRILAQAQDTDARTSALYAAWLSGCCLASVGMALHHKLCHTLGGTFGLPHAETHAIVLPHALAYNLSHAPVAHRTLARVFHGQEPSLAVARFARDLNLPRSLREIGMPEREIDRAADLAVASPYPNPRPIERDAIRALIARAWAGELPQVSVTEAAHE